MVNMVMVISTRMWLVMTCISAVMTAVSAGFNYYDGSYYSMPRLFELDDYEACLSRSHVYCVGTFQLSSEGDSHFMQDLKAFSESIENFNHTRLHRGYCLPTRCHFITSSNSSSDWFQQCVDHQTTTEYQLHADLITLDYCRGGEELGWRVDPVDWIVAAVVMLILMMNVIGTVYDVMTRSEKTQNKSLMAWSIITNWNRLIATHDDGDPRLTALRPLQGMKTLTLILVMQAHTVMSLYNGYVYNPEFLESMSLSAYAMLFLNGTVIVQTFVVISSFLFAYNLLMYIEKYPERVSWRKFPLYIVHRVVRIAPVSLFLVGLAATWWPRLSSGPLWPAVVEAEGARCRRLWWSHVLFINNFVQHDERCLVQTWFIAVDMQLYVVTSLLTLLLVRRRRVAVAVLGSLLLSSVVVNFAIAYVWDLKPALIFSKPENFRSFFFGEASFNWLYAAPWGSLPAALLGLCVAFLYHQLEQDGVKLRDYWWCRQVYRCSVPLAVCWILSGRALRGADARGVTALYAAVDRPVFAALATAAMLGFIAKIDGVWWRVMSWRGFQVLGRLSLPALMLHWLFNLSLVASRGVHQVSVLQCVSEWVGVAVLTYLAAVPASLLLETPVQKFLQSLLAS